jgi:hypothetical protein
MILQYYIGPGSYEIFSAHSSHATKKIYVRSGFYITPYDFHSHLLCGHVTYNFKFK